MKTQYEQARDILEKQCEDKIHEMADMHEAEIKAIDEEMRHKLSTMEEEYQTALDEALSKFKAVRNQN